MEYYITIHRKNKTERNPFVIAAVFNKYRGVPTRILKHRGIDPWSICCREMILDEKEMYDEWWREMMVMYDSLSDLIRDEYRITKDARWCRLIIKKFNNPFS